MKKKIIMSLIIIVIFISIFIIIKFNLFTIIFAEKDYITFENLDKVKIAYKSDGWSSSTTTNIENCEVDIEDKDFLKLLEDTYQNKIFNNYKTSLLAKGEYKIVINDNIELCTSHNEDYFCLDYNGKWLNIKANKEIYNKMIEIINEELDKRNDIIVALEKLSGSEVSNFNKPFENYIGINDYEKINDLLSYCVTNYLENSVDVALVPTIIYKSENEENIIKLDNEDLSSSPKESNYYNSLNELIQNLSVDKYYKVELEYDVTKNFDGVFLLNEIYIMEDEI